LFFHPSCFAAPLPKTHHSVFTFAFWFGVQEDVPCATRSQGHGRQGQVSLDFASLGCRFHQCLSCCLAKISLHLFCFCFCFCGTRVWIQDFILARQMCYHLSHPSSPFVCKYFWDRVSLFAQPGFEPWSFWSVGLKAWATGMWALAPLIHHFYLFLNLASYVFWLCLKSFRPVNALWSLLLTPPCHRHMLLNESKFPSTFVVRWSYATYLVNGLWEEMHHCWAAGVKRESMALQPSFHFFNQLQVAGWNGGLTRWEEFWSLSLDVEKRDTEELPEHHRSICKKRKRARRK
jgi:hypothetical protein